ncbi:MAG: hypothetical protein ACKOCM_10710 [Cyanobacteriota bacterium]
MESGAKISVVRVDLASFVSLGLESCKEKISGFREEFLAAAVVTIQARESPLQGLQLDLF